MKKIGFPLTFLNWVRMCVTSCMYSVKINGSLGGYFQGKLGRRQGAIFFVIAMQVLTICVNKSGTQTPDFCFNKCTKELWLHHLIFTNDIILFSIGDAASLGALMKGVQMFTNYSGLV